MSRTQLQTVDEIELIILPSISVSHADAAAQPSAATDGPSRISATLSKTRLVTILTVLVLNAALASFTTGILTTSLPQIAKSLSIPPNLLFWPSSVNALSSGSLLLLAGSVGDVLGSRLIWLIGCLFLGCFTLACGLARTGIQLIVFRALQGVAGSLCLTNSVSILTRHVKPGKARNVSFGVLGFSQLFGFSIGLVLAGLFESTIGWRAGWYVSAVSYLIIFILGIFAIPLEPFHAGSGVITRKLQTEIDWIGAFIATASLALFSYVLAMIGADLSAIRKPINIVFLTISVLLAPAFFFWMRHRENGNKRALIPNSLWRSRSFTTMCLMLLSSYAVENVLELLCSLYFQNVQSRTALQSSIRLLPMCLVGTVLNLTTGMFVHRVSPTRLVLLTTSLSTASPLLMALTNPTWPYWYTEFSSQVLMPMSIDVLFTVGILLTSEVFPDDTQALAAGVFNTVCQLGISLGLAVTGLISRSVTENSTIAVKDSPRALLRGYRAGFWTMFAWSLTACVVGAFGLRKLGKVGVKRD